MDVVETILQYLLDCLHALCQRPLRFYNHQYSLFFIVLYHPINRLYVKWCRYYKMKFLLEWSDLLVEPWESLKDYSRMYSRNFR